MEDISVIEALGEFGVAVWGGVIAGVAVFIFELVLCSKYNLFAGKAGKLEKAKKLGNTLIATRISCRYEDREPADKTANRMYVARYEYEVNGKRIKKQVVSTSMEPPYKLTLYYLTDPKKAFSEYEAKKSPLRIIVYIIPVIVAYFVMKALGYEF